jgi:hypothetical protein
VGDVRLIIAQYTNRNSPIPDIITVFISVDSQVVIVFAECVKWSVK